MNEPKGSVWCVMAREMRRAVSRPLYCLLTIVFPLMTFGVFVFMFQAGKAYDLPVAVCDRDFSALSRKLVRFIDSTQSMTVAYHVTDIETGKSLVVSGKAYALVVIPEHMESDVYASKAPKIVGYYNNQYLLPAGAISRDLMTVVGTVSAGINIKTRQKKGEPFSLAMEHVSPVNVDAHAMFNFSTSSAYYLVPYFLPNMIQVFVLLTTVFALGSELREGTGRDLLKRAGGSIIAAVAGKLLPYTLLFFIMGNIANLILFFYVDVPLHGSIRLITATYFLYVLAYQSLGIVFLALFPNLRMALSASGLYCSPALAFTGATFPVIGMPWFGRFWSALLPMTYFFRVFGDQAFRGAPIQVSLFPVAVLCLFAALGPFIMLPRLKQVFSDERYWGRT